MAVLWHDLPAMHDHHVSCCELLQVNNADKKKWYHTTMIFTCYSVLYKIPFVLDMDKFILQH